MRGYKSNPIHGSDEQKMLQSQLPGIIVEANPNRLESARRVVSSNPEVDVFVLDDGFQHRKLRRNFDLVLIDASNPFGFGHVLPRGLFRQSIGGLRGRMRFCARMLKMRYADKRRENWVHSTGRFFVAGTFFEMHRK